MKRNGKKAVIALAVITMMLMLTGCGSRNDETEYGYDNGRKGVQYSAAGYSSAGAVDYANDYDEGYYDSEDYAAEDYVSQEAAAEAGNGAVSDETVQSASDGSVINPEMLIYRGNISIETKDMDQTMAKIKDLISENDGFIESESYYSSRGKTYNLTVRIPSANYNKFMDSSNDAGTVVSRSSSAENVSQEYSDTEKALEIYEAQEKRYIRELSELEDEAAVIEMESRLADLQVTIAQLKSRRSQIETDVAYSYIYLDVEEVEEIVEPTHKSTFGERIREAFGDSWDAFLWIAEGIFTLFIYILPELIVVLIVTFIIVMIVRANIKRNRKKRQQREKSAKDTAENDPEGKAEDKAVKNSEAGEADE